MTTITDLINKAPSQHAKKKAKSINPAIQNASTLLFANYNELAQANQGHFPGLTYGTDRLPLQREFEEKLCELEGGAITRTFSSGLAAITHTLLAYCRSGDHILLCDNVYWPTRNFCDTVLRKFNIHTEYIPGDVGENISDYITEKTALIFLESPGSNTFEIQDIETITTIAHNHSIITILDGTWGTPLYHRPLEWGVDVVIQSITKYISGHSDLLLGTATANREQAEQLEQYCHSLELAAPPEACYNALRGLKTLHVCLAHHQQSALKIAKWLEERNEIDQVIHPALAQHPQHKRWQKYFSGAAGLFAFTFTGKPKEKSIGAFIDALQLFGIGYSWGGYKSLVTASKPERNFPNTYHGKYIIRLSIGLEEMEDLQSDLEQALEIFTKAENEQ